MSCENTNNNYECNNSTGGSSCNSGSTESTVCISSVRISPTSLMLKIGSGYSASVQIYPSNASYSDIRWYSSCPSIAGVGQTSGLILANGVGTATISVVVTDQYGNEYSDTISVTVSNTVPVNSVILDYIGLYLQKGDCTKLSAAVSPANATNKSIQWSSSNTSVATVSNGTVCARSEGSATITATAADGSGKKATCIVTATEDILVSSITIESPDKTLTVGDSLFLSATVCPTDAVDKSVRWSSSNTSVATVNPQSGLVCAIGKGQTAISATANDGSDATDSICLTVEGTVPVESITVGPDPVELYKGDSVTLSATVCPSNASEKRVCWYSGNSSVVTVDETTGVVTAISEGTTKIYAEARDDSGMAGSCDVTVKKTIITPDADQAPNKTEGSTVAVPIDVYTGAHLITNTLMSLFGGQSLKLTVHYDSTRLVCGSLGIGWYHSYEKHLEIGEEEALVYTNPSTFSRYVAQDGNSSAFDCQSLDKNGYVLTVDCTQTYPYVIDCNSERTEFYNECGEIVKIKDHKGLETQISHTDSLITITDCVSGKKMCLEKDSCGKIVRVYDGAGREVKLTYTGNLLTSIRDVNGNTLSYAYDQEGKVLSGTDSKGIRYFENTYDALGRVVTQKDAISGSIASTFSYDGNKRIITNRSGKQSTREYNSQGLLEKYTEENGNKKTYTYDAYGNMLIAADAKNNVTTYTYDGNGNLLTVKDALGHITTYTYDSLNRCVSVKDALNNVIRYGYDALGRKTTITDAKGNVFTTTYDGNGNVVKTTDAKGNTVSETVYNCLNQPLTVTDAMGKVTTYTYNALGKVESITDSMNHRTEFTYNSRGQNTSVRDAANGTSTAAYDLLGNVTKLAGPLGGATNYSYDDMGRLISESTVSGGTKSYTYNELNLRETLTNARGQNRKFFYDAKGRITG